VLPSDHSIVCSETAVEGQEPLSGGPVEVDDGVVVGVDPWPHETDLLVLRRPGMRGRRTTFC
jgi:hypothetical protein